MTDINLFFYNEEVSTAPDLGPEVHLIETDRHLTTNRNGLVNGTLSIHGARVVSNGISMYVDVNLTALFGESAKQLDQTDLHAGSLVTVTSDDVDPATYQSLLKYAKECEGKTFKSNRLQLEANTGAYLAVPAYGEEAGIFLEISQRDNQVVRTTGKEMLSYVIEGIEFWGHITFGNALGNTKSGAVKRSGRNPWGKQVQATVPALPKPQAVAKAPARPQMPASVGNNPFAR